jgi:integrase
MASKLTQAKVNRAREDHAAGTQLYDEEVSGLRLVVGKRGCSWKVVARVNDGSGRYVSVMLGRTDELSLKSARQEATEVRLRARRGEDPRRPKKQGAPTVAEALDRYLAERGEDLRPSTKDWYRRKLDGPLKSVMDTPIDGVTRDLVRSLHRRATEERGAYAANGAMRVLKAVYNDACRDLDLPPNPVARAVRMNKERPRQWAVGPDGMPDLWRRLDAMEDPVRRVCWLTMLLTGLRCGDATSIRWEHLDDDGVLTVPSPKGGPDRAFRLPLPRLLLQALEQVRQHTAPLESPWVFPSASSRSGHVEELRRTDAFPYAPHQMRHTYRSMALEAGVDFQTVTLLMNHTNPHVSFNYVTRTHLLGHMREQQERVSRELSNYR